MALSRRTFLAASSAACTTLALTRNALAAAARPATKDPFHYADPRVATGGHGHCYPGATVPFGAVQLSPDTFNAGWDWCSGYHLSDTSLMGFSHTHLSGTGGADLMDFLVMAGVGPAKLVPGSREHPETGYRSRFDHSDEIEEPGYYSVLLKDYNILAEMTATERTGLHKYTFPKSDQAYLILDLHHDANNHVGSGHLFQSAPDTLAGGHITNGWAVNRHSYFTLQVSKMPTRIDYFKDDQPFTGTDLSGANLKAILHFNTEANEAIYIKVGISAVSAEGAAKNLKAEQPGWDFDQVRKDAQDMWRAQLSKITVETANEDHKRTFYSALYHLSLAPTLFDDADGRYRGMDNEIHQLPAGQHNYTTFSLWDTYRAAHPTYALINPERVPHFANTLIRMAVESPLGVPVWPLWGRETSCMTGYHSSSVVAEAILKGFPGIDHELAYQLWNKRAMVDDYQGLDFYRKLHFIPADKEKESVSKTLEYCYDDWAVAHLALKVGKRQEADFLFNRSKNYRNYFNPANGFYQARLEDGSWALPFDPIAMGHSKKWRDYTESNSWQTTFGIQHDVSGVINLYGSREAFVRKLDGLFNQSSELPPDAPPDIAGLVGQYAHGNEPSHHIAYLYVYAGAPEKTQSRVRSLLETMYAPTPEGMQGNEDCGQMSAWFILSSLGFYSVDPVSGYYILGSPLFDKAVVQLGKGRSLEIEVLRRNPDHAYIHAFTLNGVPQEHLWFHHSDIAKGGKLTFHMGATPSPTLGVAPATLPPPPSLG